MSDKKPIVLIGVRQENRHLIVAAESQGRKIVAMVDRFYVGQNIDDLPVIASDLDLLDPSSDIYKTKDDYDWFIATVFTGTTNVKKDEENTWLLRNQRAEIAQKANLNLINIQHANSFVDPTCKLGKNIYIGWGCYVGAYSNIGNFNFFGMNAGLGHHISTGDFCTLYNSMIGGGTTIGNNVVLGYSVDVARRGTSPTIIGNNVIVAPGTTILKSVPNDTILFSDGKTLKNRHFLV
jgi:UDP-3-O-[3-hydroxymyristoyl] glucosamine N-acyltransferase